MTSVENILWVETGVKAVAGGLLVLFPRSLARVFGLPAITETFWSRLLGATLLGLAAATFLEQKLPAKNGLGLGGQIAINLTVVMAPVAMLIMGKAGSTKRGRAIVILLAIAMSILALAELAWA
ncbi:MAG: ABC transporter permease [Hyphomicrobiaceae bacterium]